MVDELTDQLAGGSYPEETVVTTVREVRRLVVDESDDEVHESMTNLLATCYDPSASYATEVGGYVAESIHSYPVGSVANGLVILAELPAEDRQAAVTRLMRSEDQAVRRLVADEMAEGALSAEFPVYVRASSLEYFENVWADRWPEFWWGWWGFALQRLGLPVSLEEVEVFRAETGSVALRDLVAGYLDAAPYALVGQTEPMSCLWCDRMFNGAAHRSDGTWVWPEDLGHAVRDHGFVVPNRLVDHVRELGSPPQRVFGPDDVLPWPKP